MAEAFDVKAVPKQYYFGRKVSFSVMIDDRHYGDRDGVDIIFEFANIPTFSDVNASRQWFEGIIFEQKVFTKESWENSMTFICGSFHFMKTFRDREQSTNFTVTASIYDSEIDTETMFHSEIHGMGVSMKRVQDNLIGPLCNDNTVNLPLLFYFDI